MSKKTKAAAAAAPPKSQEATSEDQASARPDFGLERAVERVPIDSLREHPRNYRSRPDDQLVHIEQSIREHGFYRNVVIARDGTILAGHGVVRASIRLGIDSVPAIRLDVASEDPRALKLLVGDNELARLALDDDEQLTKLLSEIGELDVAGLLGTGYADDELGRLVKFYAGQGDVDDPGPQEPPDVPTSRMGDMWLLGDHRLLCGDSTKPEDLTRLMAGEKARLLATDPPYLLGYISGNHADFDRADTADTDWDKATTESLALYDTFLKFCLPHIDSHAAIYQWHATRRQALVEQAWKMNGLLMHQTIIWVKAHPFISRSMFMWQHEPCFFGWVQGNMPPKDRRPNNQTTVWHIDQKREGEERQPHPTCKPLEIFARPLQYHTRSGEIALEPFSGSGSQIIAAEQLGRRCFAMELAPGFVDVAVRRWEKATGKLAALEGHLGGGAVGIDAVRASRGICSDR